ncbi:spartin-like [Saccoglossus kowalevskii]|uniref:Spartin-like n=1 Tax=Saccoglossus kowalevskii TaxID=10224 RepID=A0ABM0M6E6_SACKO|nr:PREDICTED: spartin-like [Saccoglossus kowalevskii]
MQTKMKRMTAQMKSRLENLERQRAVAPTAPPSENGHSSQMEIDAALGDALMYDGEPPSYAESEANAEEIICIQEGVQIYFLNSKGHVSAPSAPGPLRIFKFLNQETAEGAAYQVDQPPAFIQVCDWVYPLVPGQSPALKSLDGSYLFPDVNAPEQGSYVGLILSTDVKRNQIETFEKMLVSLAAVGVQRRGKTPTPMRPPPPQTRPLSATSSRPERTSRPPQTVTMQPTPQTSDRERPPAYVASSTSSQARRTVADDEEEEESESLEEDDLPQWSKTISHGVIKGAEWISWGLGKGAEVTGKWVHKGAAKLREQLQPNEQPTEVDPKYQKGLEYAKQATGVAVKVSGFLVDVLCDVTKKIGNEVGPVIRREGEKYIPDNWKSSSDAESSDRVDGAIHVAASGFRGFGTVFLGLEKAAKHLAKNISEATVETVDYKYGWEAAHATDTGLNAGLNVGVTAFNFKQLGIKAIAKRTAKDAGSAVAKDYVAEREKYKVTKNEKQTAVDDDYDNDCDTKSISKNGCVKFSDLKDD